MAIEVLPDAAAVASRASDLICAAVEGKPRPSLGLPTGSTPIPLYGELNRRTAEGACDLSSSIVYAIDEFCAAHHQAPEPKPGTNTHFYREHIRFRTRALHCPNPAAAEPDLHIRAFAEAIRRGGGLDLCVLGIGETGHIAFNEPGSTKVSPARVIELEASSREAHAASFGGIERVPTHGMTLGVADLFASRAVIVLATGAHKAHIVRAALEGPVGADVPASWLREHADTTWLLDTTAAKGLAI